MSDKELEALEKDARRPNRGAKYYPPSVVLALIEELKKARALSCTVCGGIINMHEMHRCRPTENTVAVTLLF